MKTKNPMSEQPAELVAVSAIYGALKELSPEVQLRALRYAAEMLNLPIYNSTTSANNSERHEVYEQTEFSNLDRSQALPQVSPSEEAEGINFVALKWVKRSGIELSKLQQLFSLGIDEIDLVAKNVPGKGKKERMRNVLLLKGVASYLSSGAPRVTNEQLKEASLHYDAYDATNYAKYIKELSADISGTKEAGFTLTARGLTAATELVKQMLPGQ